MSEILKDRALILKTYDFGETSLVVVALTREHGKLRFMVKGAKRRQGPLAGMLRTGIIGEIVFYFRAERELQLLKEFSVEDSDVVVMENFVKLCLFQAGLELVDASIADRESDAGTFDILERFRTRLFASSVPWFIFLTLEVKLLRMFGVLPSFEACTCCGRMLPGGCSVHPGSGAVTCRQCSGEGGYPLSARSRARIRMMARERLHHIADEELGVRERREIGQLLHHLFLHHVEGYRLPNALRLLKGVN